MYQLEEAHARALKAEEALEMSKRQSLVGNETSLVVYVSGVIF